MDKASKPIKLSAERKKSKGNEYHSSLGLKTTKHLA